MSKQMIIRIDDATKSKFAKLARSEGKNTSQVVRKLIENYIQEYDISSYIDDLWNRVGKKLTSRGATPGKIKKAIRKVRAEKQ
jgi:predicted DNA-binding protein